MLENGYSLADIAAATGNEGFGGNNSWMVLMFLILVLGWGGNGFGAGGRAANTEDVQNQFNFAALERQNNEIVDAVRRSAYDVTGAVKDMGFMNNNTIRDVENLVQANGYELSKGFCATQQNIDAVRYDALLNTQHIMKNDSDNTQKILDAIAGNRMQDMQNQINQLQLQNALCGVVRYPYTTTYTAGYSPCFGPQQHCQNF